MVTTASAAGARPGRSHRVYLRPEVEVAFEKWREDNGAVPVNAVLLRVLEDFLVKEGYLLPRKIGSGHRHQSQKETT